MTDFNFRTEVPGARVIKALQWLKHHDDRLVRAAVERSLLYAFPQHGHPNMVRMYGTLYEFANVLNEFKSVHTRRSQCREKARTLSDPQCILACAFYDLAEDLGTGYVDGWHRVCEWYSTELANVDLTKLVDLTQEKKRGRFKYTKKQTSRPMMALRAVA